MTKTRIEVYREVEAKIEDNSTVATHFNAGALETGGSGELRSGHRVGGDRATHLRDRRTRPTVYAARAYGLCVS